jgi:hypothetical protein
MRAGSLRAELLYPPHIVTIDHTLSIYLAYICVIHLVLAHPICLTISLTYATHASRASMRRNAFVLIR